MKNIQAIAMEVIIVAICAVALVWMILDEGFKQ